MAGLEGVGVLRAVLDGNVAAEAVSGSSAVVLLEVGGDVLNLALALLVFGLEGAGKVNAVLDTAGWVRAVVDSGLEGFDFPTVDEISVVAIACI